MSWLKDFAGGAASSLTNGLILLPLMVLIGGNVLLAVSVMIILLAAFLGHKKVLV